MKPKKVIFDVEHDFSRDVESETSHAQYRYSPSMFLGTFLIPRGKSYCFWLVLPKFFVLVEQARKHQRLSQQRLRHGQVPLCAGGIVRGVTALRLDVFVRTRSQQPAAPPPPLRPGALSRWRCRAR
jgi:hypothetical protein